MGHETYRAALKFEAIPFPEKTNYVFTRNRKLRDSQNVRYLSAQIPDFVRRLKRKKGKNIWLAGGGQINTLLLNNDLIDEMILSIHPIVLGSGIPLFAGKPRTTRWELLKTKTFDNGLLQLFYRKVRKP